MIVRVIDLTGRTVPLTVRVEDDTLSAEFLDGGTPTNVHVHALTDAEFHDVRRRGMFAGTALYERPDAGSQNWCAANGIAHLSANCSPRRLHRWMRMIGPGPAQSAARGCFPNTHAAPLVEMLDCMMLLLRLSQ